MTSQTATRRRDAMSEDDVMNTITENRIRSEQAAAKTQPTAMDMLRASDDRRMAIWHLENALDALQHPDGIALDRNPAEVFNAALVCANRLDRILFGDDQAADL